MTARVLSVGAAGDETQGYLYATLYGGEHEIMTFGPVFDSQEQAAGFLAWSDGARKLYGTSEGQWSRIMVRFRAAADQFEIANPAIQPARPAGGWWRLFGEAHRGESELATEPTREQEAEAAKLARLAAERSGAQTKARRTVHPYERDATGLPGRPDQCAACGLPEWAPGPAGRLHTGAGK